MVFITVPLAMLSALTIALPLMLSNFRSPTHILHGFTQKPLLRLLHVYLLRLSKTAYFETGHSRFQSDWAAALPPLRRQSAILLQMAFHALVFSVRDAFSPRSDLSLPQGGHIGVLQPANRPTHLSVWLVGVSLGDYAKRCQQYMGLSHSATEDIESCVNVLGTLDSFHRAMNEATTLSPCPSLRLDVCRLFGSVSEAASSNVEVWF